MNPTDQVSSLLNLLEQACLALELNGLTLTARALREQIARLTNPTPAED